MGQLLGFLRKLIMACYMQSGIQTQWNIWDVVFQKTSWWAATWVKDPSYFPPWRFWIRLWSKALWQEIHITYDILCCKSHLQMNLKKGKHFTSKDLVLVKFYFNAAVRRFLKIFRTFAGKHLWCKPFLGKFKLFKMDSGKGFFISFLNTFLWLLPNIEQKCIPLNDNIV